MQNTFSFSVAVSSIGQVSSQVSLASAAQKMRRFCMPSLPVYHDALVVDGVLTFRATGLIPGVPVPDTLSLRSRFFKLLFFYGLQISKFIEESMKAFNSVFLSLKFQCSLQTDSYEELEVMCKTGD